MACRAEICCPVVSTYKSDADPRATVPDVGCPVPGVLIAPADGSFVIMPTFVALACNVAGAVIYYTVDGSEPTVDSPVYGGPFQVSSHYTSVKAAAKLAGCDLGPASTATYPVLEGSDWDFAYLCDTGDQVGVFNEFAANGQANDYQFVLLFTLDADTEILDITILQTDETGFWYSGQSWSTTEWIYPYPDPAIPFHTYPLVLIDQAGPTQLFTSYQTSLGTIVAGTYEWRMWGQPATPLGGFFQCTIRLGDGTVIQRLIETVCTPPPPPCLPPPAPVLSATCTPFVSISATPVAACRVWRRTSPYGAWELVTTRGAGAFTYHDVFVERCRAYDYYIEELCSGNYIASAVASVFVPCECSINLSADEDEICVGDEAVISFNSENCLGEIEWGTGGEGGSFTATGVLVGTITVTPVVTTTYTFKGTSDSCGDFYEAITITVDPCLPPETCVPEDYEDTYQFEGVAEDVLASFEVCGDSFLVATGTGVMAKLLDQPCLWTGTLKLSPTTFQGVSVSVVLSGGVWLLSIGARSGSDDVRVWYGQKTTGETPVGSYTKLSGCMTDAMFSVS